MPCRLCGSVQSLIGSQKKHPNSKVYGANMGPTWGRQDPCGPHVGPMNLAIWVGYPQHAHFVDNHSMSLDTFRHIQNINFFEGNILKRILI